MEEQSNNLLIATRKGLFVAKRQNGDRWRIEASAFLGDPVSLVMADPRDGAWYAALDHGHFGCKLHRSDDEGTSWQEISVPAYPEPPPGREDKTPDGKPWPWSLKLIWALAPGGGAQGGRLWCGTIPGGLFHSDDRGESWELNRALWEEPRRMNWFGGGADLPGIHSVCVHPEDPSRVLVGVSCGGVWETVDDGAHWEVRAEGMRAAFMPPERAYDPTIQDPHMIVSCPSSPENLWCQHHNGIFRSVDGAASWQEIHDVAPSTFGFAVAVHPREPNTAWFVPAIKDEKRIPVDGKVVVTRTRDGGATFEALRNGLPQEHAYDLVYRHALAVDGSGERLAFGSTTGTVWVTENGGDQWLTLTKHLPPVYAVQYC